MNMMTFTGWVEHIFDKGQFGWDFAVTDADPDNPEKSKWPTTLKFTTSTRTGTSALVENLDKGDKVTVAYYLVGKSGTSKKTGMYYCVNELCVARNNGIRMLQKSVDARASEGDAASDELNDLPF
jgi:hypothetical protein